MMMRLLLTLSIVVPLLAQRATLAISPGLNVGKGVWSERASVCNLTPVLQNIDEGDFEQAAARAGFSWIGVEEAIASNASARAHSKTIIAAEMTEGASNFGTGVIASGFIATTGPVGMAVFLVGQTAKAIVPFLKTLQPPDFATRFVGQEVILDDVTIQLAPVGQPHHCTVKVFFARTKKGAAPTSATIP